MQNSGETRREIADAYPAVIPGAGDQYPETSMIEPKSRSVLDAGLRGA